MIFKDILSI